MSDAVEVPLTQGLVALIDPGDAVAVLGLNWCALLNGRTAYAQRGIRRPDGGWTTISLHKFLTGWNYVDHRNGNGLDNRRANLREATHAQNTRNARRRSDSTTGFKGVWLHREGVWRATIQAAGRRQHLCVYPTPEDAARAYDEAARELHGEFARLNFPAEVQR